MAPSGAADSAIGGDPPGGEPAGEGFSVPAVEGAVVSRDVPEEAEALLTGEPRIAHLATAHDDEPHVAPLWFNYCDGTVEIATTGRKLVNIRHNPRVALSIQEDEGGSPLWGITIRGTASEIDDEEEGREMLARINRRYGAPEDAWSENQPVRIDVGSVQFWRY